MKYTIHLKIVSIVLGAFTLSLLVGCNNAEYQVINDAVYLSEAYAGASKKIVVDSDSPTTVTATVRTATALPRETKATLGVESQALDAFNSKNGTNYVLLPDSVYTLANNEVTIPAGKVSAGVAGISVKPLPQNLIDTGNKYALPVTITRTSGNVLESMKTVVYILDPVIITSVPVFTGFKPGKLNLKEKLHLDKWSLEFRVNMSVLGTEIGQLNNQTLFSAYPSEIFVRFGDAPIKGNILQIKTGGTQINCKTEFSAKKWYHLAFVCTGPQLIIYVDGNLEATLDLPGKPYDLDTAFNVCGSGRYLKADVMMSELRFWSIAISQNQIQNNMFAINPHTQGLVGYWKLNEGEGTVFHDATGHGNEGLAPNGLVKWVSGIRSDGKEPN